jgi:hypothetical protein
VNGVPQKETLDKAAYICLLVFYRCLSPLFQFSLSAVTLLYLSQWVRLPDATVEKSGDCLCHKRAGWILHDPTVSREVRLPDATVEKGGDCLCHKRAGWVLHGYQATEDQAAGLRAVRQGQHTQALLTYGITGEQSVTS